jgi:hypothetical protein
LDGFVEPSLPAVRIGQLGEGQRMGISRQLSLASLNLFG